MRRKKRDEEEEEEEEQRKKKKEQKEEEQETKKKKKKRRRTRRRKGKKNVKALVTRNGIGVEQLQQTLRHAQRRTRTIIILTVAPARSHLRHHR